MTEFLKSVLGAQPYALFLVAGLFFIAIAVIGSIKTYFDPGDKGRIASGVIGSLLVISGLFLYRQQMISQLDRPPRPDGSDTSPSQPTVTPEIVLAQPVGSTPGPLIGVWRGLISFPQQVPLHFVLHISGTSEKYVAVADSPDQGAVALPVDSLTLTKHRVHFTMPQLGVEFSGDFTGVSGGRITGTLVQRGMSSALRLTRD